MSKAFTSEETPEPGTVGREPPRVRPGEARYVTPEGHAALRVRVDEARAALRELPADSADREARSAELLRRIALLEGTLAALTVLGPGDAPEGVAAFGCWVTVEDDAGRRSTWRLVGPDEADARLGLVSAHAPVGRALLGRAAGDEVEVERPDGLRRYTVVEVRRAAPGGAAERG